MYLLLLCDHWGLIYRLRDYKSVSVNNTIVKNNNFLQPL